MVIQDACLLLVWSRQARQDPFSGLAEVGEHGVDELEGLVDFLADLGTSQDDLAGDEDEEDEALSPGDILKQKFMDNDLISTLLVRYLPAFCRARRYTDDRTLPLPTGPLRRVPS